MSNSVLSATTAGARPESLNRIAAGAPGVLIALMMLTIPLEFTELWFPNQLIQVGRFVMVAIVFTLVVLALWGRQAIRLPTWTLWVPPAAFLAYALISALVTRTGPGLKTEGAALAYGLVGIAIYNWTRTVRAQDFVWVWFAVSCIGLALIGIVQRITGGYIWRQPDSGPARINGTFADPNVYGRVLTIMVVAGVALAPFVGRRTKAVMIAAVVLSAAVLPFTYSREAWVIGGGTLLVAVITSQRKRQAISIAAGAIVAFLGVTFLVPQVQARFSELQHNFTGGPTHIFNQGGLAFLNYLPLDTERHYLIAAGLQMFYDHPIFGLGFGGYPGAISTTYNAFMVEGYRTIDSHTTLITILAELGVVGLVAAVWWLYEYVRTSISAIRRGSSQSAYVIAPLLGVIVILLGSQLQGRLVEEPYLWILLGLAASAIELARAPEARPSQPMATTTRAATSQNSTARSFFQ